MKSLWIVLVRRGRDAKSRRSMAEETYVRTACDVRVRGTVAFDLSASEYTPGMTRFTETRWRSADGYAPIRGYGAIGDGRTLALVAMDGSIDWLALPRLDESVVFGALVDVKRGGSFKLAPTAPYEVSRRYVGSSNVLETTFWTATGVVRVFDALLMLANGELPWLELCRFVEVNEGEVEFGYRWEPRFDFGDRQALISEAGESWRATAAPHTLSFRAWHAGCLSWGTG